jgi:guanosine-diphosphatase
MTYTMVNEDLFHAIKPGLSSYPDNPDQAANSLKPLLDLALDKIPTNVQKLTRISLKATAGLRLISETKADRILEKVESLFNRYPFYMRDDDVSILDGKYEGIYSWITLNYAKGRASYNAMKANLS